MSGMVWVLRDEHGTLLGASAERRIDRDGVMVGDGPYAAIGNAFGIYSTLDAAKGLTRAVENESGDAFECAGYTLGMEHAVMVNEPPHMAEIRAKQAAVRAVIDAARAAESTLNGVALAEAHYGGQSPDDLLALLDTLAALRTLEGPR